MVDDFAVVDAGDGARLIAMMHATDGWPAVRELRTWVLDHSALSPGARVVDVGCGPGTFGALAVERGAQTIDVDRSLVMLAEVRRARPDAHPLCADVMRLPFADGHATLTRAERILQWTPAPDIALAELYRVTAPGGTLAVTDTDWTAFGIDHDDPGLARAWSAAALGWVPHPGLARALPGHLAELLGATPQTRRDTVTVDEWDPDDGAHGDGPPGLPLTSIAAGAPDPGTRAALLADVPRLAARAREGRFRAGLDLVTALGRRPEGQKSVRYSSS